LNYQLDNLIYTSAAPANFILLSIVAAMIPYLISAVLSFLVAFIVSSAIKSTDKKDTERLPETQTTLEEVKS
jgi:mannitol-specific phosphotransferase system IIBC component